MKKKGVKILVIVVGITTCFYFLPFLFLFQGRDYTNHLLLNSIAQRKTEDSENDSLSSIQLFHFVMNYFKFPDNQHYVKDVGVTNILQYQFASCDQQANVLITLARFKDIDGRLLFLRGNDSISGHSVCELEIDGKYRIFDPFLKTVFFNKKNCLATFEEIQKKKIKNKTVKIPSQFDLTEERYFHFFDKKYPAKLFKDNSEKLSKREKIERFLLSKWYSVFRQIGLKRYLKAYFRANQMPEKEVKQTLRLLSI